MPGDKQSCCGLLSDLAFGRGNPCRGFVCCFDLEQQTPQETCGGHSRGKHAHDFFHTTTLEKVRSKLARLLVVTAIVSSSGSLVRKAICLHYKISMGFFSAPSASERAAAHFSPISGCKNAESPILPEVWRSMGKVVSYRF